MPGDQGEQLAVVVRQPGQRLQQRRALDHGLADVTAGQIRLGRPRPQLLGKRVPPGLGAIGLAEDVAGDAEQPGQRRSGRSPKRRQATQKVSLVTSSASWRPARLTA
jgi:hypothetical protein